MALLDKIEKYISMMKSFYEVERSIINAVLQRQALHEELIKNSRSMELPAFQNFGTKIITRIRNQNVIIVQNIKKWRKFLQGDKAMFLLPNSNDCALCSLIRGRDLQSRGGIPLRKLKFFCENYVFFVPKNEQQIHKELAIVYKRLKQELYTAPELGYYKKIWE
jgi:hypothetical protein